MTTKTVTVPNISCGHCVQTIKMEVSELEGVKNVEASADTKQVTVEWSDPQTWEGIEAVLKEINFPPNH